MNRFANLPGTFPFTGDLSRKDVSRGGENVDVDLKGWREVRCLITGPRGLGFILMQLLALN